MYAFLSPRSGALTTFPFPQSVGATRALQYILERRIRKGKVLRPERPFTGVSGPKIAKKSQKESFWGSAKKGKKYPKFAKLHGKLPFCEARTQS